MKMLESVNKETMPILHSLLEDGRGVEFQGSFPFIDVNNPDFNKDSEH